MDPINYEADVAPVDDIRKVNERESHDVVKELLGSIVLHILVHQSLKEVFNVVSDRGSVNQIEEGRLLPVRQALHPVV